MTVQNAAEFLAKVGEDNDLAAQLQDIHTAEEFIRFASTQGYEFTQEDIAEVESAMESDELSEDQLEAIAGGGWFDKAKEVGEFLYENRSTIKKGYDYVKGWF